MPDPSDEELVRRLLADARHDEPMPAQVVARLDGVLDELAAGGRLADGAQPPRRRHDVRRRWVAGLVAAAVVLVGGVALRTLLPSGGSSSDAGGTASSKAASDSEASGPARPSAPGTAPSGVPRLHRATLDADVRRAVRRLHEEAAPPAGVHAPMPPCADADWGQGEAIPVYLDDEPAMLALRPRAGRQRVAEVLECGTARVLASVTVPTR